VDDLTFLMNEGWESKLADTLPTDTEQSAIEMLIGNDYYFELLLPRKMELGGGLFLFSRNWDGFQEDNTHLLTTLLTYLVC